MLILESSYRRFVVTRSFVSILVEIAGRGAVVLRVWDRELLRAVANRSDVVWC